MADGEQSSIELREAPAGVHRATEWYRADEVDALAAHIRHPSSPGFMPKEWVPMIREFLEAVRNR
ncbi:MAG TPA: hypothetical protein VIJ94_12875 [Caulobacteraceae bacterium]